MALPHLGRANDRVTCYVRGQISQINARCSENLQRPAAAHGARPDPDSPAILMGDDESPEALSLWKALTLPHETSPKLS